MTMKDKIREWKDRCSIMCSCGEEIVAYYCNDSQCPYNKSDPLYCSQCVATCEKHEHIRPPMIFDKMRELDQIWTTLKEDYNTITSKSSGRYHELEPLINYFEHEMLIVSFSALPNLAAGIIKTRQISDEIKMLGESHSEFRHILAAVEAMVLSGDLIQLLSMGDHSTKFRSLLHSVDYLRTLSESDLFDKYYPAIISSNTSPFSNFT